LKGKRTTKNVKNLTIDDYVEGILNSDITILSRAITLVESNLPEHNKLAQELLSRIIPLRWEFNSSWNYWLARGWQKYIH
jgi:hypothetical protein